MKIFEMQKMEIVHVAAPLIPFVHVHVYPHKYIKKMSREEKAIDEQIKAYRLELKRRELAQIEQHVNRVREQDEYHHAMQSMDEEQFIRYEAKKEREREQRKEEEERRRIDRERDERDVC
jgi:hypothetical protein